MVKQPKNGSVSQHFGEDLAFLIALSDFLLEMKDAVDCSTISFLTACMLEHH